MFIRSERLFLRPGWPEDWEELEPLVADENVARNLTSVPWPYTSDDARRFLELPAERMLPRFLVTVPGDDGARLIGCIGFDRRGEDINLGYWIARDYWDQGYASEAARAVIGIAALLGYNRIVASHYIDNPASGRVLEQAGFRRTGRIVERYSKARGMAYPAREYALELDAPGDCDDDEMAGNPLRETEKRAA